MHSAPAYLSKSAFINGKQCPKRLWLQYFGRERREDTAEESGCGFQKGREIGILARDCFPGGQLVATEPFDAEAAVAITARLMKSGSRVIYEASFLWDGLFASVDILVRRGPQWHAYEVKSGTSIKEHYLADASFQLHVLRGAGVSVSRFFIMHVDSRFQKFGPIEPSALFQIVPVMRRLRLMLPELVAQVETLKQVLSANQVPEKDIGPHCSSPHPCPFTDQCWSHIPTPSIFDIMHLGGTRKFELYYQGVYRQEELPDGYHLSEMQKLQVSSTVSGMDYVNESALKDWLNRLVYPLYLMDFECFQPAVPLYDGTRPYQQIPFQFSVHRTEFPGGPTDHKEFLAESGPDPRPAFIESLLTATGTSGTVLAYNKSFELGRLRELAVQFPDRATEIQLLINRVADLMEPFEKKWYYTPGMQGSHSIKSVLPAMVPGLHYQALAISNGQAASEAFEGLIYLDNPRREQEIKDQLLAYCKLDTEAMVYILEKIQAAVGMRSAH
jgi:hypothetical protein